MKRLNIGCGTDIQTDTINLDVAKLPGVDIVHDLNKFPYPFKENEFDEIICNHVFEHLDDPLKVLLELQRISKIGGIIKITVPAHNCVNYYTDLTHKHPFTFYTFDYLDKSTKLGKSFGHEVSNFKLKQIERKIVFGKVYQAIGFGYLATKFHRLYNSKLLWIFPALELKFVFKKIN